MMVPVEGSEEVIPADVVLIAAGFLGSEKYVTDAFKVAINGRTNVDTKPEQYQDLCRQSLHSRRHAQRPVPGSMGNPRRQRSCESGG